MDRPNERRRRKPKLLRERPDTPYAEEAEPEGSRILELFTEPTDKPDLDWKAIATGQQFCRYLGKRCDKRRKSQPEIAIGTCSVEYGNREPIDVLICPHRFLERKQIFMDSQHLLTLHEPGNELHIVSEQSIPGGSVDYFLVSARKRKVVDFLGLEIQALDTTGTAWPERQAFLKSKGLQVEDDYDPEKSYGMNWKMTAKTTMIQLHHKIETFEGLSKHLVLVLQDCLLAYMRREFDFDHIVNARVGDSMHFHSYRLVPQAEGFGLELADRWSTDAAGVAKGLGIQGSPKVELETMLAALEAAISDATLLTI